jgi:hypothetical protein
MPSKRDKSDPKESDEDSGVITDEDKDKPQNGNKSPDYADPYVFPASTYKLKKEYDKALQVRKRILNDKSLSEEVRTVHLRKSKLLIEDMTREIVARLEEVLPSSSFSLRSSLSFSRISSSRSPQFVLPLGLLPAYAPEEAKSAGLEPLALSMPEAGTSLPLRTGLGPLSPPLPVSFELGPLSPPCSMCSLRGVLLNRVS